MNSNEAVNVVSIPMYVAVANATRVSTPMKTIIGPKMAPGLAPQNDTIKEPKKEMMP